MRENAAGSVSSMMCAVFAVEPNSQLTGCGLPAPGRCAARSVFACHVARAITLAYMLALAYVAAFATYQVAVAFGAG